MINDVVYMLVGWMINDVVYMLVGWMINDVVYMLVGWMINDVESLIIQPIRKYSNDVSIMRLIMSSTCELIILL
jgi:hypothetical protein